MTDPNDARRDALTDRVFSALQEGAIKPHQIATRLGLDRGSVAAALRQLQREHSARPVRQLGADVSLDDVPWCRIGPSRREEW